MPGENDLLADLLDDEIAAEDEAAVPNASELSALKEQVEALQKEKTGLLKSTQDERAKRQRANDRLNKIEGAVSTMLSQRQQQGIESVTEAQAADAKSQGIPVNYDDDGNGWIDPNFITQFTTPYEQKIAELEQKLQQTNASSIAQSEAEKIMNGIIGENEQFGPASGRYRAARKWVEDEVSRFAKENAVNRIISSGEALDYVFDAQLRKEFSEKFDKIDIVDIVTAEDSQDHFRRMLGNVADTMAPDTEELLAPKDKMDSRFQKVMKKPSTLGNQANAKAGQVSVLERLGSQSAEDIMDLDDAQIDALMKLMSKE